MDVTFSIPGTDARAYTMGLWKDRSVLTNGEDLFPSSWI